MKVEYDTCREQSSKRSELCTENISGEIKNICVAVKEVDLFMSCTLVVRKIQ